MHVEHIIPNGDNNPLNLCLSCSSCNLSKGIATSGFDVESGETVAIFNPRTQQWQEHFEWLDGGLRIHGRTPTGRVTVARLKMNQPRLILARRNWIAAGNHPPQ
jgi:hypothetical protein